MIKTHKGKGTSNSQMSRETARERGRERERQSSRLLHVARVCFAIASVRRVHNIPARRRTQSGAIAWSSYTPRAGLKTSGSIPRRSLIHDRRFSVIREKTRAPPIDDKFLIALAHTGVTHTRNDAGTRSREFDLRSGNDLIILESMPDKLEEVSRDSLRAKIISLNLFSTESNL